MLNARPVNSGIGLLLETICHIIQLSGVYSYKMMNLTGGAGCACLIGFSFY